MNTNEITTALKTLEHKWRERCLGLKSIAKRTRCSNTHCEAETLNGCTKEIESLLTTPASECEWHEDGNGPWSTGCGGMFEITDGTPEQNKMKFCPYCGKLIKKAI